MMEKYGNLNVINHNFYGDPNVAHAWGFSLLSRHAMEIQLEFNLFAFNVEREKCEEVPLKVNGIFFLSRGKFLHLFTFHLPPSPEWIERLPEKSRCLLHNSKEENTARRRKKISMFTIGDMSVCTINKPSEEHKKMLRECFVGGMKNEELAQ